MNKYLLTSFCILFIKVLFAQHSDSTLQKVELQSHILNEKREVYISLPEEYKNDSISYPTLYLLDGLYNYQYMSAAVNMLAKENIIPQMIIVCIKNTNRMRDMTPTNSEYSYFGDKDEYNKETGQGLKFLQFINKELAPLIDTTYRTSNYKILSGHSFTGLATLLALHETRQYFNAYIAIDPSVWWDNGYMVKYSKQHINDSSLNKKTKLFIGGSVSGEIQQKPLMQIIDVYSKSSYLDFSSKIYKDETHISVPYPSHYDALKFIFKEITIPYDSIIAGKESIDNFKKSIKNTYDIDIIVDEFFLINESIKYLSIEQLEQAINILKVNFKIYPKSSVSLALIADCYRFMNNNEKAKEYFKKVLEIEPKNQQALEYLNK
jgi:hypothetical protein